MTQQSRLRSWPMDAVGQTPLPGAPWPIWRTLHLSRRRAKGQRGSGAVIGNQIWWQRFGVVATIVTALAVTFQ